MAAPLNNTPQSIVQAFQSLALSEGLSKKSRAYKERRRDFIANSVQTGFIAQFGANTSSLQSWNRLCETVLGDVSERDLTSIRKCKGVSAFRIESHYDEESQLTRQLY